MFAHRQPTALGYAKAQFSAAGYRITCVCDDDRHTHPDLPITEYEERMSAQGATVHGIYATPDSEILCSEATLQHARELPQSLYDYLPQNVLDDTSAYVPHGMGYAIENFRNRRMNAQARLKSQHKG